MRINQVLREIWPFGHELQSRNFGQFNFWEYQTCQQTVHKIVKFHSHFQLKSKQELIVKLAIFDKKINLKILKQLSRNKNKQIIFSFDGLYSGKIFVIQAMPPL